MIDVIRWHVNNHEAMFSCWRFCTEYSLLQVEMGFFSGRPTANKQQIWPLGESHFAYNQ